MQTITLYRTSKGGKTTITPKKPKSYTDTLYRLVAEEGKELVKGDVRTPCIDTDEAEGWTEEDAQEIETDTTVEEQLSQIRKVYADEI